MSTDHWQNTLFHADLAQYGVKNFNILTAKLSLYMTSHALVSSSSPTPVPHEFRDLQ